MLILVPRVGTMPRWHCPQCQRHVEDANVGRLALRRMTITPTTFIWRRPIYEILAERAVAAARAGRPDTAAVLAMQAAHAARYYFPALRARAKNRKGWQ